MGFTSAEVHIHYPCTYKYGIMRGISRYVKVNFDSNKLILRRKVNRHESFGNELLWMRILGIDLLARRVEFYSKVLISLRCISTIYLIVYPYF